MSDAPTSSTPTSQPKRLSGWMVTGVAVGTSILSAVLIAVMLAVSVPFLLQQRMEAMSAEMGQSMSGGTTFSSGGDGGLTAPSDPLSNNASMIEASHNMNPDSVKRISKFVAKEVKSGNNNSPMGYELTPEQWTELAGLQTYDNPGKEMRIHVSEVKGSSAFCVSEWAVGTSETLEKRTFASSDGTTHTWKEVFSDAKSAAGAAENSCAQLFVEDNA